MRLLSLDDKSILRSVAWQGSGDDAGRTLLRWFREEIAPEAVVKVGAERYDVGVGPGRIEATNTLDILTTLRGIATGHGAEWHLEASATAKRMAPNELLQRLNLWVTPADVGHDDAKDANDATRHAIVVLATRHASIYAHVLGGPDGQRTSTVSRRRSR
jgi:hypothetical protein